MLEGYGRRNMRLVKVSLSVARGAGWRDALRAMATPTKGSSRNPMTKVARHLVSQNKNRLQVWAHHLALSAADT